jgi:hypothetical protein
MRKSLTKQRQCLRAVALSGLLAVNVSGMALAMGPMTPYENGYHWIGEICNSDPRRDCVDIKCDAGYPPPGSQANQRCKLGALDALLFFQLYGYWP